MSGTSDIQVRVGLPEESFGLLDPESADLVWTHPSPCVGVYHAEVAALFYEVLKPDRVAQVYCEPGQAAVWQEALFQAGFQDGPAYIIATVPHKHSAFCLRRHRLLVTALKGDPVAPTRPLPSVWHTDRVRTGKQQLHDLARDSLAAFTRPGGRIFDPYGGNGVLAVECARSGREALLLTQSQGEYAEVHRLLAEVRSQLSLPIG